VTRAGVARVGNEESASSLDVWGSFGANRESKGSGERLSGPGGGVGGGEGLVHLRTGGAEDLRLANFDMDVVNIASRKYTLAVSRNFDTILGREESRENSYPYNSGRGTLASVPHANWVQTRTPHPFGVQIVNHGGTDCGLPDLLERVQAERTSLLGKKICFGARRLDPDVGTRASDQKG
jgi:hypothetical protein